MTDVDFATFEDFWPHYLNEHANRTNRALHAAGTTAAIAMLGVAAAKRDWKLAALAPLLGYGPAWAGHFFLEKNRPTTFSHPVWSLRADLKMAGLMLQGKLDDELARLSIQGDVIDLYA